MSKSPLARRLGTITAFALSIAATVAFAFSPATVSAATPDPLIDQQWGLADIGAAQVWSQSTGVGVTVAIIDGGSGPHADLDANLDPGQSIIEGNRTSGGADSSGSEGHGTEVAGIVAAVNGNGIGISGVAPNARILPIRVFEAGRPTSNSNDVALAVRFAVDAGARVINLSLGSDSEDSRITSAVAYAVSKNVLVVAAAGNEKDGNINPKWPAVDDNTIAVQAVDDNNKEAIFALHGDYIDLSAPGVSVMSTKTSVFTCNGITQPSGYGCDKVNGTSFAAPFVSGAAALLFSARPQITAAQVRFLLTSTAIDLGDPGKDTTFGAGLINLPAAFAALNIMFPMVNDPIITTLSRVGFLATGTAPTNAQSPQLQWFRCTAQGAVAAKKPTECTAINNAVALTYQMTVNDLGKFLRFGVRTTTAGVKSIVLSATSPRVNGVWLKVDGLLPGNTYTFGQLIGSPSKGIRSIKVVSGACFVKNSALVVRPNATECKIKVTISAKSPFPQLGFTAIFKITT
ncbi:MAG: S8 family serine peptidase [Ilumatobacteraceae bacterium]